MKKLIACLAMFAATFFLLSLDTGGITLFERLHRLAAPVTGGIQRVVGSVLGRGWDGSRAVGRKLFQNSVPNLPSSPSRATVVNAAAAVKASAALPQEDLREAERAELRSLIKDYAR